MSARSQQARSHRTWRGSRSSASTFTRWRTCSPISSCLPATYGADSKPLMANVRARFGAAAEAARRLPPVCRVFLEYREFVELSDGKSPTKPCRLTFAPHSFASAPTILEMSNGITHFLPLEISAIPARRGGSRATQLIERKRPSRMGLQARRRRFGGSLGPIRASDSALLSRAPTSLRCSALPSSRGFAHH